jgi:hypothetical protein
MAMNKHLLPALAATLLLTKTSLAACPAGMAVYSLKGSETFSASLSPVAQPKAWSDVQFSINTPSRAHSFELTESNGYAVQYLLPLKPDGTLDEETGRDISVTFFDEALNVLPLPQSAKPAPTYIFAPQIGSVIYYGYEPRELLPLGMWKLSGCAE